MIDVTLADIATVSATAIMHPVSAEWDPVTQAMRRLEIAAGEAVAAQSEKVGELPIGSAVITAAGDLNADFLIHVIVRSVTEPVSEWVVQRGLQNGLRRCVEWGIDRVAVPAIGTGAGNLDAEEVASLMIPIIFDHMNDAQYPTEVLLVADSEYERDAFQQMLRYHDLPYLSEDRPSS
ncbi:MAG TPA: macro domain-containing protein [Longimicrobiales bacterium]|nr:macro domain-containing protein [Longimicrobiales bacterium]